MTERRGTPPADLLLGRSERSGDLEEAAAWVRGRRVLVTGAAGSVGWPLAHALLAAAPASLTLVDHHEHSLFSLERSLGRAREGLGYELVDVRDERRMDRVFDRVRPEAVVHLAAAKHVPYGERFPEGVVEANVFATQALLDLARRAGTETFVYPSSDKSVTPSSLYGATKRLCEALVQRERDNGRRWLVVRFVNIVGTRGSVIETFTQQVQDGLPLSVTDERMTRYWISMNEALWLVLRAARAVTAGQVLMPDCGDPIPVLETARRLGAWYCPEREPYPVQVTGIRPGERLHEILLSPNESAEPGPASGVLAVRSRRDPSRLDAVPSVVAELRALAAAGDDEGVRSVAMAAADALQ